MSRRRLLAAALLVLAMLAGLAAAFWLNGGGVGRTPGEIIRYTERRLEGHPKLEQVALPVLAQLRSWLGVPDDVALQLPFVVPPLPVNPATTAAGGRIADVVPTAAKNSPRVGGPTTLRVGAQRAITSIAMAARLAQDGDTVEIDPGDYHADVTVWDRARLTIRGMGPRVRLIAAGASAEGKAIWVIRRGRVLIEGIDFVGARVADRNGAGIRMEGGQLTVRRCLFFDNQNGILTGGGADARLDIEHSEFAYNGDGDGQSHHLYVGAMQSLRVVGSYFHHANGGHQIKSRAAANTIEYNRLSDESGGRASYELEFPNGGMALVLGNIIQQGAQAQNSVMVSMGAEGYKWPRNELHLAHNTLVNDHPGGGTFVHVNPGVGRVVSRNNVHAGHGRWLSATTVADSDGDQALDWTDFHRPTREDYRLNAAARQALANQGLAAAAPALTPQAEYLHPLRPLPLAGPPLLPGALQTAAP